MFALNHALNTGWSDWLAPGYNLEFALKSSKIVQCDDANLLINAACQVIDIYSGLLFLRDLVMVDPDDRIEVSTVTNYYKHQLKAIDESTKLDDMLEIFKVISNIKTNYTWSLLLLEGDSDI